ncbi:MAG: UDP-N-acetylglucosamine--N-acetylmuramyl-(pentapeptide) pyrophosphoryl-undecaprenol N-acetylglucosamine transferase, partial [Gemmatimonadales bacterium]
MPTVIIAGGGTGGHLMPALAIAERIRALHPDIEPVLVGAVRGVEREILPKREFRFHLLPAEPIYRRQWWRNARWPMVFPRLMHEVRAVLDQERPAAALGTGGYAAGPLVWSAARRGIPCAIQEQNASPGIATRFLARRVSHMYLGVPEIRAALPPLPDTRLFDTGNPIVPPDPG